MTVTKLIENFRAALIGVLPAVQCLHIPWQRPLAYDEWDSIATTLYSALVIAPCRWSVPESDQERFRMAPYDLLLESYAGYSLIQVGQEERSDLIREFHSLGSINEPFDTIECRMLASSGAPLSDRLETYPLHGTRLALRHVSPGGEVALHWDINNSGKRPNV